LSTAAAKVVEGILDHPGIDAVSFVGSAPVAKLVYERAAKAGKRVQALGGAKNHMVVMPDAVIDKTVEGIIGSAFGAAGQRCMAGSVVVTVGEAHDRLMPELVRAARALRVGDGIEEATDVGPVVSCAARDRIREWIDRGGWRAAGRRRPRRRERTRSQRCVRRPHDPGRGHPRDGNRARRGVRPRAVCDPGRLARSGDRDRQLQPVRQRNVDLHRVWRVGARLQARGPSRHDRSQHRCGGAGRVLPVSGWKDSFLGDLHAHGPDAVQFFTRKKTTTSRWFSSGQGSGSYFVER
jgi:malonate-semialdehyde dehydrogenase (acetylating)/methylmalonate-semialdehyde dehydrogenase